jgi:hypothetical protein
VFSDKEEIEIFCGWEGDDRFSQKQQLEIQEENIMDLKELKVKHPDLYEQIVKDAEAKGQADAEEKFKEIKSESEGEVLGAINKLTGLVESQGKTIESQNEKILSFEKLEDIRSEKDLAADADKLWDDQLSASSIREERFEKIKKHVVYSKFVKDGKLDREKFSEAVSAEIKEWEGVENNDSEILGAAFSSKEDAQVHAAKLAKEDKEDDDAVNEMLAMVNDPAAEKAAA